MSDEIECLLCEIEELKLFLQMENRIRSPAIKNKFYQDLYKQKLVTFQYKVNEINRLIEIINAKMQNNVDWFNNNDA